MQKKVEHFILVEKLFFKNLEIFVHNLDNIEICVSNYITVFLMNFQIHISMKNKKGSKTDKIGSCHSD